MVFDPATVDLSFVEPALRADVLHRISVLERFLASRGRAAEIAACGDLGISRHQLHVLARAWTSRRRAEDVTLRATKRRRPSSLDADVITLIGEVADDMRGASVREIEVEVARRAADAGLTPPSYPTVNKYVRERARIREAELFASVEADLILDVIVSDLPTSDASGERIRPHVLIAFTRHGGVWPASLRITADAVMPSDLADLIAAALAFISPGSSGAEDARSSPLIVSMPADVLDDREVECLAVPGLRLETREANLGIAGRLVTAALGTSLAGYKLRPKLIGAPRHKRLAGYPQLAAASPDDAATYLLATARDGRTRPEPPLADGRSQRIRSVLAGLAGLRTPSPCSAGTQSAAAA